MSEHIAHSGAWGLALIMIVVVSWFYYRTFAPKGWREWTVAGIFQAFVISLYAEMYGFPLTIYLLVRFAGLDRGYLNANLWSTLLGMGETGMLVAMLFGYTIAIAGVGILIQGWRELYRAHRDNRLASGGLYALVRHPQYTGLFIALFGEGIVHWPTIFSAGLFPVIVLGYTLLARKEEKEMVERLGEEYRAYRSRVPMFFPRRGRWGEMLRHSGPAAGADE